MQNWIIRHHELWCMTMCYLRIHFPFSENRAGLFKTFPIEILEPLWFPARSEHYFPTSARNLFSITPSFTNFLIQSLWCVIKQDSTHGLAFNGKKKKNERVIIISLLHFIHNSETSGYNPRNTEKWKLYITYTVSFKNILEELQSFPGSRHCEGKASLLELIRCSFNVSSSFSTRRFAVYGVLGVLQNENRLSRLIIYGCLAFNY